MDNVADSQDDGDAINCIGSILPPRPSSCGCAVAYFAALPIPPYDILLPFKAQRARPGGHESLSSSPQL